MPPGEPWRNGYVDLFSSRIRDECRNINSFWSLANARVVISDWKHDYTPPPTPLRPELPIPTHRTTTLIRRAPGHGAGHGFSDNST